MNNPVELLFASANTGNIEFYKQAIAAGVNINTINSSQECALTCAVKSKSNNILNALLLNLCDTEIRDRSLRTPLHIAIATMNVFAVSRLLSHRARIDVYDTDNKSPMDLAVNLAHSKEKDEIIHLMHLCFSLESDAQQLELSGNLKSLFAETDVISQEKNNLKLLRSTLPKQLKNELKLLESFLVQPEQLLAKSRNAEASLTKRMSTMLKRSSTNDLDQEQKSGKQQTPDELIKKITFFKTSIEKLKNDNANKIIICLDRLLEAYTYFKTKLAAQTELAIIPRTQVRSSFGWHYLNPYTATRFHNHFEGNKTDTSAAGRDNPLGLHSLVKIRDNFYKLRPTDPSMEKIIYHLYRLLPGNSCSPTNIIYLNQSEQGFAVQSSKAIAGENFMNLLTTNPESENSLNDLNFDIHFLVSVLVDLSDGKPENFIAENIVRDSNNRVIDLTVKAIDSDLALKSPILKRQYTTYDDNKRPTLNSDYILNMKSAFLCMPNHLNKLFSPIFLRFMLNVSPEMFILKWLSGIHSIANDKIYDLLSEKELEEVKFPLKFYPGTFVEVLKKLNSIQKWLRENPRLTRAQLLEKHNALLFDIYSDIMRTPGAISDRIARVYDYTLDQELCSKHKNKLKEYNKTSKDFENGQTQSIESAETETINSFDYATFLDPESQKAVLTEIVTNFSHLQKIIIRNCSVLDDDLLQTIAKFPHLTELKLYSCSGIRGYGLLDLVIKHPHIKIELDDFSKITIENLSFIIETCPENFSLIFYTKSNFPTQYSLKDDLTSLLQIALANVNEYHHLIVALAKSGTQVSSQPGSYSVLEHAITHSHAALVKDLLYHGSNTDILMLDQANFPLDLAIQKFSHNRDVKNLDILLTLIKYGAIYCNPLNAKIILKEVLAAYSRNPDSDLHHNIYNFCKYHNLLTTNIIDNFLNPNLEDLDFGPPDDSKHKTYFQLDLTIDMINAMQQKLPRLTNINISGCRGLTEHSFKTILNHKSLKRVILDSAQAQQLKIISLDGSMPNNYNYGQIQIVIAAFSLKSFNKVQLNYVCGFLEQTHSLKYLELTGRTSEPQAAAELLIKTFEKGNNSIERLTLNNTNFGDETLAKIIDTLLKFKKLKELSISSAKAGPHCAKSLKVLLEKHESLECLCAFDNFFGDEGIKQIASGLTSRAFNHSQPYTLKSLDLNQVGMAKDGAIALANSLMLHQSIKTLDIRYNKDISNDGIEAFIKMLGVNKNISNCMTLDIRTVSPEALLGADTARAQKFNEAAVRNNQSFKTKVHHQQLIHTTPSIMPSSYYQVRDLQLTKEFLLKDTSRPKLSHMFTSRTSGVSSTSTQQPSSSNQGQNGPGYGPAPQY